MERERKTCAGIESNNVFWLSFANEKPSQIKCSNWKPNIAIFKRSGPGLLARGPWCDTGWDGFFLVSAMRESEMRLMGLHVQETEVHV